MSHIPHIGGWRRCNGRRDKPTESEFRLFTIQITTPLYLTGRWHISRVSISVSSSRQKTFFIEIWSGGGEGDASPSGDGASPVKMLHLCWEMRDDLHLHLHLLTENFFLLKSGPAVVREMHLAASPENNVLTIVEICPSILPFVAPTLRDISLYLIFCDTLTSRYI